MHTRARAAWYRARAAPLAPLLGQLRLVVPVSSREVGAPDNRRDQAVVPLHQKAKRIAIAASGPGRKLTVDRGGFVSGFHVS